MLISAVRLLKEKRRGRKRVARGRRAESEVHMIDVPTSITHQFKPLTVVTMRGVSIVDFKIAEKSVEESSTLTAEINPCCLFCTAQFS